MLNLPQPETNEEALMGVLVCVCFYLHKRTHSAQELFRWCLDVLASRSEYTKAVWTVLVLAERGT